MAFEKTGGHGAGPQDLLRSIRPCLWQSSCQKNKQPFFFLFCFLNTTIRPPGDANADFKDTRLLCEVYFPHRGQAEAAPSPWVVPGSWRFLLQVTGRRRLSRRWWRCGGERKSVTITLLPRSRWMSFSSKFLTNGGLQSRKDNRVDTFTAPPQSLRPGFPTRGSHAALQHIMNSHCNSRVKLTFPWQAGISCSVYVNLRRFPHVWGISTEGVPPSKKTLGCVAVLAPSSPWAPVPDPPVSNG